MAALNRDRITSEGQPNDKDTDTLSPGNDAVATVQQISPYNPELEKINNETSLPNILNDNDDILDEPFAPSAPPRKESNSQHIAPSHIAPDNNDQTDMVHDIKNNLQTESKDNRKLSVFRDKNWDKICKGWWWKTLIVLFFIFLMTLFFVWIGPSYIWGDNAENGNNSPLYDLTKSPTLEPTKYPVTHIAPTIIPTLLPSMPPTLEPTTFPTLEPTQSPIEYPTAIPTKTPTLNPTYSPTYCPVEQGHYSEIETCEVISRTEVVECDKVMNGFKYDYTVQPHDCTKTVQCTDYGPCYNDTHYYEDGIMYQEVYQVLNVGDLSDCTVFRLCDDGTCDECDNSNRYHLIFMMLILVSVIIML